MAFVCTFALASCTNPDTSQPEQTQPVDTTAQTPATEQPAAAGKTTKTDQHGGGSHGTKGGGSTKGDATTPKGDATTPNGTNTKPEGNNSDRGTSVTTGSEKNTRDVVNPAMRKDNVANQKDRDVKVVKP